MKIGQKPELPSAAAQAAGSAKQQARTGAAAASAMGQGAATAKAAGGAPVSFSSAARGLEPATRSTSDFDVDRVNAMRAAIANGTFQFSAQAVADKMLSNAYEMFSHARAA